MEPRKSRVGKQLHRDVAPRHDSKERGGNVHHPGRNPMPNGGTDHFADPGLGPRPCTALAISLRARHGPRSLDVADAPRDRAQPARPGAPDVRRIALRMEDDTQPSRSYVEENASATEDLRTGADAASTCHTNASLGRAVTRSLISEGAARLAWGQRRGRWRSRDPLQSHPRLLTQVVRHRNDDQR